MHPTGIQRVGQIIGVRPDPRTVLGSDICPKSDAAVTLEICTITFKKGQQIIDKIKNIGNFILQIFYKINALFFVHSKKSTRYILTKNQFVKPHSDFSKKKTNEI